MASLSYRIGLLRGLLSRQRAYVGPFYVHIDVTHRCNLRCLCCRWHSPLIDSRRDKRITEDMPYDMFLKLCDELHAMGTQGMYFVGTGEPMMHPRFFDMIATAKERSFEVVAYTNGLSLDEANIHRLMELKLNVLRVSIWSPDPVKFIEQVDRATPETFQRIIDGMTLLSRLKAERKSKYPLVELCQSITHHDVGNMDAIIPLAQKTGCEKLCFSPLVDFNEGEFRRFVPDEEGSKLVCASLKKMKGQLARLSIANNINTMLLHYKSGGKLWKEVPCYPAWYFSYFRSDGKVFICQRNTKATIPVGDLRENRFEEIWNNDRYRAFRRKASTCEGLADDTGYFCDLCSHSMNSQRIHQRLRFFKPLERLLVKAP